MNLPNKLTMLRIVLAPIFLLFAVWEFPFHNAVALVVFIAAALTDLLDGRIARAQGLVSNLGKFLDPLADKMLTTAAFLVLMMSGQMNIWALMIVLTREFMVTSVRLLAAKGGTVIAASFFGKLKTVAQFVAIIYTFVALEFASWQSGWLCGVLPSAAFSAALTVGQVLIWISVALTAASGVEYVFANRHFFQDEK